LSSVIELLKISILYLDKLISSFLIFTIPGRLLIILVRQIKLFLKRSKSLSKFKYEFLGTCINSPPKIHANLLSLNGLLSLVI